MKEHKKFGNIFFATWCTKSELS